MSEILQKIRRPSIFILLLILNLRFLFTVVLGERQEILTILTFFFFLLSFDYTAMRREYLYWLGILVIISLAQFTPYKQNVLTPIILMQCISTLDLKTYLRYNIIILGGTALLMLLFVGTGRMIQAEAITTIRIRYDFGYGHPNAATLYYWGVFISLLLYCYISKYRNFIWILLGFLLLISVYLYIETDSRSFIFAVVSFILVLCYFSLRSKFTGDYRIGYSRYVLYVLPVVLAALTIYFAINVNDYPVLNILLSKRLTLYKDLLDSLTPLQYLWGTTAFDYIIVDNSYLHLLFEAGVLVFAYFIWLWVFAVKNMVKQQNFILIAVFVSFLVYGLMESLLLFSVIIGNNIFWVLLYRYRYGDDELFDPESKYIDLEKSVQ